MWAQGLGFGLCEEEYWSRDLCLELCFTPMKELDRKSPLLVQEDDREVCLCQQEWVKVLPGS